MDDLVIGSSRFLKDDEGSSRTDLQRAHEPEVDQSYRPPVHLPVREDVPRTNRRWEGNWRHKSRGSLLYRQDAIIPHQPRIQDVKATPKPKVHKAKKSLRVNPDINIPSTVSVGNLARLLGVNLGKGFGLFDYGI